MNMKVCEGLEIVNVDESYLRTLKTENNTLECGASQILEGLSLFVEDLLDKYEDEAPYDKLFYAVKQVITSASENSSVRDAIMTGIITETKEGVPVIKKPKPVQPPKVVVYACKKKTRRNVSAVSKYAKTHTINEICEHFKFKTRSAAKSYLVYHNIEYKRDTPGPQYKFKLDVKKVKAVARI